MQVIAINSQKGGSGKSMLTKHLSVEAERDGDGPVFIIDTDEQATVSAWHESRDSDKPQRVEVSIDNLGEGLAQLRSKGAALCFIDTPSGALNFADTIYKLADFVIFPVQPSEDDLRAAPVTVRALNEAGLPFVFVLTRVKPGTLITAQAAAILSKHGEVAATFVNDRTGYKSPYGAGQTITEAEPKGAAAKEIASLWKNIKTCMHANMHKSERVKAYA